MAAVPWNRRRSLALCAGIVLLVFAGAYWTVAGGGFISDDFRWILESRVSGTHDIPRLFVETTGFYRPVVSLMFAALERLAGLDPRPYGLVTFSLALMCAAAVGAFALSLGLRGGAALLAASLWLLNPHGINMAVLWISGLTALSLVFFSTTSAIAVHNGRPFLASTLFLAALLSKEEAVLLPIPLLLLSWQRHGTSAAQTGVLAAGFFIAEAIYVWLRSGSDAMTPANAPTYYRFTFELERVAANVLQYADRALTIENAFRAHLPDALELYCGERPEVWMVPAPSDAAREQIERVPGFVRAAWRYRDGQIERVDPGRWIGSDSVRMR